MRRIAFVTALVASLAALPALAADEAPARGTEQDPFSQSYTGVEEHPASAARHHEKDAECHCAHDHGNHGGHDGRASKPDKA